MEKIDSILWLGYLNPFTVIGAFVEVLQTLMRMFKVKNFMFVLTDGKVNVKQQMDPSHDT